MSGQNARSTLSPCLSLRASNCHLPSWHQRCPAKINPPGSNRRLADNRSRAHDLIPQPWGGAAMTALSRRNFLALTGGAAVAGLAQQADAAMGPNDKFDLVIKGGDVL